MFGIPSLSGIALKLLGAVALVTLGFVGGCRVESWKDASDLAALKLKADATIQKAQEAWEAQGLAEGQITITAGAKFAAAQQQVVTRVVTQIKKVPIYVSREASNRCVIPVGLVRLLNAAASGDSDPDTRFPLPAGESNDTGTGFDLASVAAAIVENYGRASANAQQLDALNQWIRDQQALIAKSSK